MIPVTKSHSRAAYQAALGGAAFFDGSHLTRIEHRGADALDLLHRLSTNDLLSLGEGGVRRTVITTAEARIVDVVTVVRRKGRPILLIGSAGAAQRLLEWLDKFTFAEDSEPRDRSSELAQLTLVGPESPRMIASLAGAEDLVLPGGACGEIAGNLVVARTDALGIPVIELVSQQASVGDLARELEKSGAVAADRAAWDALRVARGAPEWGSELDERVNPHEANLNGLIDFQKGCYVGQEVVARLDTYDKVQRRLVTVRCDTPLVSGAALAAEGRKVGEVRTVAAPEILDAHVALAFVRRGHWDPGTRLAVAGGGNAAVVSLPLA